MKMTPTEAVQALRDLKWSEAKIGEAVGANQSTIHRIGHGAEPLYSLGQAIIELWKSELAKIAAEA